MSVKERALVRHFLVREVERLRLDAVGVVLDSANCRTTR